jgi:hypothetical protein
MPKTGLATQKASLLFYRHAEANVLPDIDFMRTNIHSKTADIFKFI